MTEAIRKHLRDFIAVAVLVIVSLVASYIIVQQQRLRIPILEEKPFELKAEFETAQAVVPGQGQTIRVAGVRVGDVQSVELDDGLGVVTFAIDREFLPVYRNATVLLRPTTGLKDMFFQLDPGSKEAGEVPEGGTIPVANTAPDVNLDQILEALDGDTQAYLRLLLVGAGEGLDERGRDLGEVLGGLGPINRDLKRLNSLVAERRTELARLVHNFNVLTDELGRRDDDINQFVSESNTALSAIAEQDPDVRRATAELSGTLSTTKDTLADVDRLALELGPAFESLRPFARNLVELNSSTRDLADAVTPVLRDEIRPFVRTARPEIPPLRTAARRYSKATPKLVTLAHQLNRLGNMAAYNPRGQEPAGTAGRDEGYLYWVAWLGHVGNNVFSAQDAHGLYRRIYFTLGCPQAQNLLASSPLAPIVTPLGVLFEAGGPCNP